MTQQEHEHVFRRATNLELFLDLVFVFAVTQIASLIAHDLTWSGCGRGALSAWLVWWLWSQFAWAGTTVDLDKNGGAQMIVLATVPIALLMGVALPEAYRHGGPMFGGAYLAAQLCAFAIQGREMWPHPSQRAAFLAYIGLAGLGPVAVAIGGIGPETWRVPAWGLAALLGVGGALLGAGPADARGPRWRIDPGHFSERHALIVIIALGEVLIAAGTTAYGTDHLTRATPGLLVAVAVACVVWWLYFAFIPRVAEHALAREDEASRPPVARNLFTFGHFPIVFGVITFAVVAKHVTADGAHALGLEDRLVLATSVASLVGGFMGIHWLYNRGVAPERPLTLVLSVVLVLVIGDRVPGTALVAIVGGLLLAMQTVSTRLLEQRLAAGESRRHPE